MSMSGRDEIHQLIVGGFIFVSFVGLIAGTLLTFLLTSWRAPANMDRLDDCSPSNFASYIDPDDILLRRPITALRIGPWQLWFCDRAALGALLFSMGNRG
jgi:hypothetical protein